jgi:DNA-binding response OmpR family regulator
MSRNTILVADDDEAILDVMKIMFSEVGGYEVVAESNGKKVVETAVESKPDVVLLDLWLSGINGREICKALKQDSRTSKVPVMLFSANRDIAEIAEECGADGFIEKPFQMKELLGKVEGLVKTK